MINRNDNEGNIPEIASSDSSESIGKENIPPPLLDSEAKRKHPTHSIGTASLVNRSSVSSGASLGTGGPDDEILSQFGAVTNSGDIAQSRRRKETFGLNTIRREINSQIMGWGDLHDSPESMDGTSSGEATEIEDLDPEPASQIRYVGGGNTNCVVSGAELSLPEEPGLQAMETLRNIIKFPSKTTISTKSQKLTKFFKCLFKSCITSKNHSPESSRSDLDVSPYALPPPLAAPEDCSDFRRRRVDVNVSSGAHY